MAAALSLSFLGIEGIACHCSTPPTWVTLSRADIVFIGTAAPQTELVFPPGPLLPGQTLTPLAEPGTRFRVEEVFKGEVPTELIIRGTQLCQFTFLGGRRYLVFASSDRGQAGFVTSQCSGTQEIEFAASELAYLRFVAARKPGSFVVGWLDREIVESGKDGGAGVTVTIESGRNRFQATADAAGKFFIEGVPAGNYRFQITSASALIRLEAKAGQVFRDGRGARTVFIPGSGGIGFNLSRPSESARK